jgi:hypothetical protein
MLEALPEETTQLLIDICTNPALLTAAPEEEELSPTAAARGPSYLSYLNLGRGSISVSAPASELGADGVSPPSRRGSTHDGSRAPSPPPGPPPAPAPLKRPSPRLYFANFVGHRAAFVMFLETVARRRWGQTLDVGVGAGAAAADLAVGSAAAAGADLVVGAAVAAAADLGGGAAAAAAVDAIAPPVSAPPADFVEAPPAVDADAEARDQAAVWNTLLELYLSEGLAAKAWAVLASALPYDAAHALVLCTTRSYTRGLVLLWTRLGMHEDVLRFWMERARAGDAGAGAEAMRVLDTHGGGAAGRFLFPLALRFLTESAERMARHRTDLERVLRQIEERAIMPPLAVVQVLSRNGVVGVGVVKEWLLARMHEAREEIHTVSLTTHLFLRLCAS